MNNKKILIAGGLGVILILLIILAIMNAAKKPVPPTSVPANTGNKPEITIPVAIGPGGQDQFRAEVPAGLQVPGTSTVLTEEQKKIIAVPTTVVDAAPGTSAQRREFNISATGGKFVPAEVIARMGDTVHVNFTAVDGDYDIVFPSYNMKQVASKGQTKILEFQALKDGSFLYYCDSCGGPDGPTTGKIIIVK
jgi:plastocyanin